MPIIINEFEVVAAPEPKSAAVSEPVQPLRPQLLTPEDIGRMVERRIERLRRVWAD
jgi:hypothetical protein